MNIKKVTPQEFQELLARCGGEEGQEEMELIDLQSVAKAESEASEIFEGDALEYLQGIYKGRIKYDAYRFRAANAAVPYERPKLAVAAVIHHDGSFADRLEKAISRSQSPPKLIEQRPPVQLDQKLQHSASELGPAPKPKPKPNNFIRRS
jgi:hypothetical protein